jgi:hypothetical protein
MTNEKCQMTNGKSTGESEKSQFGYIPYPNPYPPVSSALPERML